MTALSHLPRRLGSPWALLLAGPVVGTTYFWLVYLLAEATCAEELELLGTATLRVAIVAATVATAAVLFLYAWRARRLWPSSSSGGGDDVADADRRQNRRFMVVTGLMLLGMFLLFVLFVAAPVIGSSLC